MVLTQADDRIIEGRRGLGLEAPRGVDPPRKGGERQQDSGVTQPGSRSQIERNFYVKFLPRPLVGGIGFTRS